MTLCCDKRPTKLLLIQTLPRLTRIESDIVKIILIILIDAI